MTDIDTDFGGLTNKDMKKHLFLGLIKRCRTKEELDSTFKSWGVSDIKSKISVLESAMGATKTFYTPANPTDEEKYESLLAIFLDGTWRNFA